ncbi:MAG: fatty acid desaturase [Gemmatimonadaceae bacterium]
MPLGANRPGWRDIVATYVGADVRRSLFQVVTTLTLLAIAFWAAYRALPWSLPLAVLLAIPTGGLLVRTFILMHDCAHGSLFTSRRANDIVGAVTGVLTLTPFAQWRRDHALHHASSGDLDRRGHGDVPTLTVREYLERTPRQRLAYRLTRHPASLLVVGPLYILFGQRIPPRGRSAKASDVASVLGTDAAIALLATATVLLFGWPALLLVYLPAYYIAAASGIWIFYVQHQFEDAYWESHATWDYATAALRGSSHLELPRVLQWFTGSIGLHHIHHLAPRIPNYRLQSCHDANPLLQQAPKITLRSGSAALRLALWDEDRGRLVRFADVALQESDLAERAKHGAGSPTRHPEHSAGSPTGHPERGEGSAVVAPMSLESSDRGLASSAERG